MGGLANQSGGRYIGANRGKTTGDVTGGGGRSVMPRSRFLRDLAEGRRRQMALNQLIASGGGAPATYEGDRSPLVPPGGWQSGGQMQSLTGAPQAPRPPNPSNFRTGFEMNANMPWMPQSWRNLQPGFRYSLSAHSLPKYLQHHFKTRSGPNVTDILEEQPAWWPESARGWRAWQIPRRGIEGHRVGVAPTGTRNLSGSGGRGGYSGGVIPRFQTGRTVNPRAGGAAARRRNRPMESTRDRNARLLSLLTDAEKAKIDENIATAQAQGHIIPPGGWSDYPYPRPPGGGYSGGVIPRFQSGRTVNPRAVAAAARRRNAPPPPQERIYPPRMLDTEMLEDYRSSLPVPPGGWQEGGVSGYSHGGVFPRHGSVTKHPTIQGAYTTWKRGRTIGDLMGGGGRSIMPTHARGNYNFNRSELFPNWSATGTGTPAPTPPPPGGWQEGGQLEEPLFPVESELADESPWYPDEEVGFEEEFPTQGGFDIFGRSGG